MPEFKESSFLSDAKKELAEIEQRGRRIIRNQKRQALERNRANILEKQKQISGLVTGLYEKVYEPVNGNHAQLLMDFVKEHVAVYGPLDEESSENSQRALTEYNSKHDKVGFYYRQYEPKPDELFERCFGAKPKGKVQLILGPMTLCFRCFDEEDYIFAYTHYLHEDKKPTDTADQKTKAMKSQGVAFSKVKIADLAGAVIMEKASNNYIMIDEDKRNEVRLEKNRATPIKFDSLDLDKPLWWRVDGAIPYQFSFRIGQNGIVVGVTLFDNNKGDFIFYEKPTDVPFTHHLEIPGEKFRETEYVDIAVDSEGIRLFDHSRKQNVMEYDVWVGEKQIVDDEKLSKAVRRHEEQHQFNKLFVPKEEYMGIFPDHIQSLEKMMNSNDPKEAAAAKKKMIVVLARHYRRMYMDYRARDEIIAYYKEGRNLVSIAQTLKASPLYDYAAEEVIFKDQTKLPSYRQYIEKLVYTDLGGRTASELHYIHATRQKQKNGNPFIDVSAKRRIHSVRGYGNCGPSFERRLCAINISLAATDHSVGKAWL